MTGLNKIKIGLSGLALAAFASMWISFLVSLPLAQAYFIDQGQINNNLVSMGDWTAPESTEDPASPVASWVNSYNIPVYVVSSDSYSRITQVSLYYSYGSLDSYNFVHFATLTSAGGDFISDYNISVSFNFTAPLGDGHYDLAIIAQDEAGNQEDFPAGLGAVNLISLDVDTHPPTTALSLGESDSFRYLSSDEDVHGGFEAGDLTGFSWGGTDNAQELVNDPVLAHNGEGFFKLGYDSTTTSPPVSTDYLTKTYLLTKPSWLSFWWRYISEDYVDFDFFQVKALSSTQQTTILNYGLDIFDPPYDTGWQEISFYFDDSWVGQVTQLSFELKNSLDTNFPTQVLIDDIRLVEADFQYVSEFRDVNLMAKDASGSGVAYVNVCIDNNCSQYLPDPVVDQISIGPLPVGDVTLEYWSQDEIGQSETTKSAVIKVKESGLSDMLKPSDPDFNRNIVLNQILPDPDPALGQGSDSDSMPLGEWVEIFNRHPTIGIDVNNWYLTDAAGNIISLTPTKTLTASTIVPPLGSLVFYLNQAVLNNSGDNLYLYDSFNVLIDKISYPQAVEGKSWARDPDGFGGWMDPAVGLENDSSKTATPSGTSNPLPEATSSAKLSSQLVSPTSSEVSSTPSAQVNSQTSSSSDSSETDPNNQSSELSPGPSPITSPTPTPTPALTLSDQATPSTAPEPEIENIDPDPSSASDSAILDNKESL